MNIFWLSHNPVMNAQYHCDKHVIKMVVEIAQLLSTAHRVQDGTDMWMQNPYTNKMHRIRLMPGELVVFSDEGFEYHSPLYTPLLYKSTHEMHPCAQWVRENTDNYYAAFELLSALLDEYRHRYHKRHATTDLLPYLENAPGNMDFAKRVEGWPQCMPPQYRGEDVVEAYRRYYCAEKKWATWTGRPVPHWFTPEWSI